MANDVTVDHDLAFMPLWVYDLSASATMDDLTSSGRGMFFRLLIKAWTREGCLLPVEEQALRNIAMPDNDSDWRKNRDLLFEVFPVTDGKRYNVRQMEEYVSAQARYQAKLDNIEKTNKKKAENQRLNKLHDAERHAECHAQRHTDCQHQCLENEHSVSRSAKRPASRITHTTLHTTQDHNVEPPRGESGSAPVGLGEVLARVGGVGVVVPPLEEDAARRLERLVGEESWRDWGRWYEMALELAPAAVMECLRYAEDCSNPKVRQAKDLGELRPEYIGKWFTKRIGEAAAESGVNLPSRIELNGTSRRVAR